jgi:outer membrane protein with beta-barrel domain
MLSELKTPCCYFEDGDGSGLNLGATAEYWINGDLALNFKVLYSNYSGNFVNQAPPIPDTGGGFLRTEYEFQNSVSYLNFEISGKYRLFNSHLHIGASLFFGIKLNESNKYYERIVSGGTFNDGTKEKELKLDENQTPEIASILLMPKINLGYDIDFGLGTYITPFISAGFPILSLSDQADWNRYSLATGVSVFWAIK